ncbi:hypothetical protein B0H19DRAFT_1059553 [Mycena capillaripes]|nr:hypothetical protein B0H19DRAFT_1059553 [Mycena capillaripes]
MHAFFSSGIFLLAFFASCSNALYLSPTEGRNLASNVSPKLIQRVTKEFIGFHGTNSKTAALWVAQGTLMKPKEAGANSDNKQQGNSRSGADEELGVGLYVADIVNTAQVFAANNARNNPGTTAKVCAIFAKDADNWKKMNKVQLFSTLVRRATGVTSAELQAAQTCYLGLFGSPPFSPRNTLVFSDWGSGTAQSGQVLIPEGYNPYFSAECFDPDDKALSAGAILRGPNVNITSAALEPRYGLTRL